MSVTNFYANQEIFVTGVSGFIGKALLEKLLRSFPNIGKIFVLMRSKKGKTANERLEQMLSTSVFERARNEQPEAFSKIYAIAGDCQELNLSISSKDLEKIKNVSLIFHVAASVRFDDNLKSSILLNTRGTHELVKIATTLKNLKVFIHFSTSYSNPHKSVVEEKIYPPYADWRTSIKLAETYDDETLNILFLKYSSHQPNTYTFTKSLAEHVINDYRNQLPVMILRPSIVISSVEEPAPGWIDNFNGPIGMLVACGYGLLRTNYGDPSIVADFIPVDVIVRSSLIAAYKLAISSTNGNVKTISNANEVEVINCANDVTRCISLAEFINIGKRLVRKNPLENCILLPGGSITKCPVWHYIRFFTLQIGLALILDVVLSLAKQKPFLLKLQRRIHAANVALYTFMTTEWRIHNDKFLELENLLPPEDINKLSYNHYAGVSFEKFISIGIRGCKQYLLKETPEASERTKMRLKVITFFHYSTQFLGIFLIGYYLISYFL